MSVPGKREQRGNAGRHSQDGLFLVIYTMCVLTLTRVGISSRRPPHGLEAAPPAPPPRPKRRRSPLGHAEAAPPAEPATASVGRSKGNAEWSGALSHGCGAVARSQLPEDYTRTQRWRATRVQPKVHSFGDVGRIGRICTTRAPGGPDSASQGQQCHGEYPA